MNLITGDEPGDRFLRARLRFVRDARAIVERSHLMGLERIETDAIETCATDGARLLVNVAWMETHTEDQMMGVLAHEARHCVLAHPARAPDAISRALRMRPDLSESDALALYNCAADLRINRDLLDEGWSLPECGYRDEKREFVGWSVERIFTHLLETQQRPAGGGIGDFMKADFATEAERRDAIREIERVNRTAARIAKKRGTLPGSMEELLDVTEDVVSWDKRLASAISRACGADDYSMARISNSARRRGVVFPGTIGYSCGHLVIALDTSGSISSRDMADFLARAISICRAESPERITIIQCDAAVRSVTELTDGEEPPRTMTAIGRGGTSFVPVFDHIRRHGMQPEAVIYFTDLAGVFPHEPAHHTIWMSTTGRVGPFGETIHINQ